MNSITVDYLHRERAQDGLGRSVLSAVGEVVSMQVLDLSPLPRPLFLDRTERQQLERDLSSMYWMLRSLPDLVAGGDVSRLCSRLRLAPGQIEVVRRTLDRVAPQVGRADIYQDDTGFRMLELNLSGALGGIDTAALNRAVLAVDGVGRFVRAAGLTFTDPLESTVAAVREHCGRGRAWDLRIVLVNRPNGTLTRWLQAIVDQLHCLGVDASTCGLDGLAYRGGRVVAAGREVDVVYRFFTLEELADTELLSGFVLPLLDAYGRQEVDIFPPFETEVYSAKQAVGLLMSDECRARLGTAEQDLLDRFLPWTREVGPGRRVGDGGGDADLVDYCRDHQDELLLKPSLGHGGHGIVAGWCVPRQRWAAALDEALRLPFVVQRRVRPRGEPFADPDTGEQVLMQANWGVFVTPAGFAGTFVRAAEQAPNGVVSMSSGARFGCVFHE